MTSHSESVYDAIDSGGDGGGGGRGSSSSSGNAY